MAYLKQVNNLRIFSNILRDRFFVKTKEGVELGEFYTIEQALRYAANNHDYLAAKKNPGGEKMLKINQCVYVKEVVTKNHGKVTGWGKVTSPGKDFVRIELATGLVGDDWAEIDGGRFWSDEKDDRVGTIVRVPRETVYSLEELGGKIGPGDDIEDIPWRVATNLSDSSETRVYGFNDETGEFEEDLLGTGNEIAVTTEDIDGLTRYRIEIDGFGDLLAAAIRLIEKITPGFSANAMKMPK